MKIGAKLKMTKVAIQSGLDGMKQNRTGVFCGFAKGKDLIRVRRDGVDRSEIWHQQFWEEEI